MKVPRICFFEDSIVLPAPMPYSKRRLIFLDTIYETLKEFFPVQVS